MKIKLAGGLSLPYSTVLYYAIAAATAAKSKKKIKSAGGLNLPYDTVLYGTLQSIDGKIISYGITVIPLP